MGISPHATTAGATPRKADRPRTARRVRLFGLNLTDTTTAELLGWLRERVRQGRVTTVNFVNAHCLNTADRDAGYRRALAASDRLLPDGSGVALATRLHGERLTQNLNGTDLFPHLCRTCSAHGLSLYLLGAAPGIAWQVARNMERRFPGLRVAGAADGFFGPHEEQAVVERINRSGADVLLVAMGVPRQELWLARHREQLTVPVRMGVGGLFDFYAGRIPRAPAWLRRLGMEWVWRLLQEPGRMWRRYLLGNPLFVLSAMREALRAGRRAHTGDGLRQGRVRAFARRLHWWLATRATPIGRRALDLLGAGVALLLATPLMALTAAAIRLESPGSVFFAQERVGERGRTFRMWKFRSMYPDAEARRAALTQSNEMDGGVLFKMERDPRITRVGRVIRRLSIDELPQLWNVLRGDMALVGPRPALPAEVAQYSLGDRRRLLARPGITCIWQISGRSAIPFPRQVEMDLEYIHQATVTTDLQLLAKTVPAVISGRGAY